MFILACNTWLFVQVTFMGFKDSNEFEPWALTSALREKD